jgi:hypothetical protein
MNDKTAQRFELPAVHGVSARLGAVTILSIGLMLGVIGCSTTEQQQPNIIAKAQGAQTPVPAFSGFLGYYGRLQPGGPGQALYRYVNPNANWSQYNAIIVEPISFWDSEDSSVSPDEQQLLCSYFTNQLKQDLVKYFNVVDQPGPGVMRLQGALTNASAATPVLRTVSVVVPQARLLNRLQSLATGKFAFVGSARVEAKLSDSQTGDILAEFLDQQFGGNNIQTAATWQWQDTERIMNNWSSRFAKGLNSQVHGGTMAEGAAGS